MTKADYVNALIEREKICSVIDFGVGDGYIASLLHLPRKYIGIDPSPVAVGLCRRLMPTRRFRMEMLPGSKAELVLSLDVIFHLVNDREFDRYIRQLFESATRFVCVFSTNYDRPQSARHVRHRFWTTHPATNRWERIDYPDDEASAGFHLWRSL